MTNLNTLILSQYHSHLLHFNSYAKFYSIGSSAASASPMGRIMESRANLYLPIYGVSPIGFNTLHILFHSTGTLVTIAIPDALPFPGGFNHAIFNLLVW